MRASREPRKFRDSRFFKNGKERKPRGEGTWERLHVRWHLSPSVRIGKSGVPFSGHGD